MAQTVVDLTLGTIRDLLIQEAKFLSGVSDEVEDVQNELQRMQCFLEDVDRRKSEQDQLVLNFVREIRSLCYRVEDVVEAYATEVVLRKRRRDIKKILKRIACSLCECKSIHEVGTEIAGIKQEISKLTASMETYGIMKSSLLERQKSHGDDGRKRLLRQTYGFPVGKDFVGMKNDIDTLVAELLHGEVSKNRVVSICGMGGLGKTTLAQKIYHHNDIRRRFEAFAWVCVSKDYKTKDILQDLLVQLSPSKREEAKRMEENELVREVHKVLEVTKCLTVLDDIWELNDWKCVQQAFALEEATSKVLITTRNENVARVGFFHRLGFLNEDEAWELLQKKAFIRSDCKDSDMESKALERIGREMVSKCGYLPLAISVLGGILSEKKYVDEWDSLNRKINVNMRAQGSTEKDIRGVLNLSYDDLPYRLKPCFLYLCRFQEDQLIEAEDVCLLWIVEGLVSPKDQEKDETLRDVALRYLRELVSRSLVQLQEGVFFLGEEFYIFRVHDLFRDLCLAKSNEEEFFYVMDFRHGKDQSINPSSTPSCLRRLAILANEKLDGVSLTAESFQSLRSLLLRDAPTFLFTGPKRVIHFNKLKCLRVLNFDDVDFEGEMLPTEMSKLINLKLLSFRRCVLKELPSWVGDLSFLQALHLHLRGHTKIPNVLWKIKGLKYLFLPHDYFVAEEKLVLDGLNELETLYNWNSEACEITDVSNFKNLRCIGTRVYGNENLSKFVDSIEGTHVMKTFVRVIDCDFGSEEGMALFKKVSKSSKIHLLFLVRSVNTCKLPDYEPGFFPNLGELYLFGGNISKDPMGTLEKLPNLRKLFFSRSFVGKEMTCHANGFPQLRHLQLEGLYNLEEWRVEEGAMPCLSHLEIIECYGLVMIPDGIKSITTIHTLNIYRMPDHFNLRVKEGGEDFDKVCHVNSITIRKW